MQKLGVLLISLFPRFPLQSVSQGRNFYLSSAYSILMHWNRRKQITFFHWDRNAVLIVYIKYVISILRINMLLSSIFTCLFSYIYLKKEVEFFFNK